MAGTGSGSMYDDDDPGAGAIVDINITPLVDIVLVLLIVFMVTAKLIMGRAIPVESPKAQSGEQVTTTLALTIDKNRQLYLNGEPSPDRARVSEHIKKAVATNPEVQAIVTADVVVPHGDVMELIDMVKVAGVKKFALTVEEKAKP
jgi:biopolymer transport protein ExbD